LPVDGDYGSSDRHRFLGFLVSLDVDYAATSFVGYISDPHAVTAGYLIDGYCGKVRENVKSARSS